MGRGNHKRKTLVIDIVTGEKNEFDSRFAASKFTGIARKSLNAYIEKGTIFQKKYKFIDLD